MLQDVYAYQHYYLEAAKYIKNLYGIDLGSHSPAVKGTLYSMAIRSGALCAAQKFAGCTDKSKDATMLNTAYKTYGNEDAKRWTKAGQWGDALAALDAGEYTEVPVQMPGTAEEPHLYRVRLRWGTDMATQIGAFSSLEKAKALAGSAVTGYKVFDETGTAVYDTGELTPADQKKIALKWALDTAADDSHGYENGKAGRGGPDYACSSFVNEAWRQAGVALPESGKVYTANMLETYRKAGFADLTAQVDLKTGKGLQAGDVCLTPGKHVEMADGKGNLVGARINELGTMTGGKPGDQTGGEIAKSLYWNYPWNYVLRYLPEGSSPAGTMYFVQAGLFKLRKNAERLVAELAAAGFEAIVKPMPDGKFRAQAGAFEDKKRAKSVAAAIRKAGFDAVVKKK